MRQVTITLPLDILQETIIALRDRFQELDHSLSQPSREHPLVRDITRRQIARVKVALQALEAEDHE